MRRGGAARLGLAAARGGAPRRPGRRRQPSVHVVDFNSTKGTFVDQGAGWKRLPPNVPTLLPPGGSVRFGECSTVLQHLVAAPEPEAAPAPAEDANAAVWRDGSVDRAHRRRRRQLRRGRRRLGAGARHLRQRDRRAGAGGGGGGRRGGGSGEGGGGRRRGGDGVLELRLPQRAGAVHAAARRASADGDGKKKKKKKKRGRADDSDDSDGEPAAPLVLEKEAAGAAGLILRK